MGFGTLWFQESTGGLGTDFLRIGGTTVVLLSFFSFRFSLLESRRGRGGAEGEEEGNSFLGSEPDVGLDARTQGPRLELKADL